MKKLAMFLTLAFVVCCLAVPAAAADFTPSVSEKTAPTISIVQDSEGNDCIAIIYDADGNEVIGIPDDGSLVVTPLSEKDDASEDISDALANAYAQIAAIDTLEDLAAGLTAYYQEKIGDSTASVSNLVVRDLFDVSVYGTYADYLAVEGNTITIRFELDLDPDAFLAVLHNYSDDEWELVSDDRVVRNSDGSVDVTFDSLSPVAFVVDGSETEATTSSEDSETSPQTGETSSDSVLWAAAAVLGCGAVAMFAVGKKKSSHR